MGAGHRIGNLGGLQDLGTAELGDLDGSHRGAVSQRGLGTGPCRGLRQTDQMVCDERSRIGPAVPVQECGSGVSVRGAEWSAGSGNTFRKHPAKGGGTALPQQRQVG
ncbi:hypothetical protein GCM10027570_36680 [Streptomonospora sediminis]